MSNWLSKLTVSKLTVSKLAVVVCVLAVAGSAAGCNVEVVSTPVEDAMPNASTESGDESEGQEDSDSTPEATEEAAVEAANDSAAQDDPALPEVSATGVEAATAEQVAEVALNTLADENIDPSSVTSIQVEAVDWPDAGLGCPQPGEMYASVITPGYRIVLETASESYDVHAPTRLDLPFVLCDNS